MNDRQTTVLRSAGPCGRASGTETYFGVASALILSELTAAPRTDATKREEYQRNTGRLQ
jgi:hypothetical protein